MQLIHALLCFEGFKTDSHEAAITFLGEFHDFDKETLEFLDRTRKMRNGIKYEGMFLDAKESQEISNKQSLIYNKLLGIAKNQTGLH